MPTPAKSRFWRRARLTFRWFRITCWLLVLALICAVLWLNRVGLPDFLMQRLRAELRAQGAEVTFRRIRLRWYRGIVADEVRLEQTTPGPSPRFSTRELVIRLDPAALLHRQLKLRGVTLTGGSFSLPLGSSNRPQREVVIEDLGAQVDFNSEDRWQLSALEGRCLGVAFHLSGTLTNASAFLKWKPGATVAGTQRAEFWDQVVSQLEQIQFAPEARMKGTFIGDGGNPEASSARVELTLARLNSPWGSGRNLGVLLTIQPKSNTLAHTEIKLTAQDAQTRWGRASSLRLDGEADLPFAAPRFEQARLNLEMNSVTSPWGRAQNLALTVAGASLTAPRWAEDSHLLLKARSPRTPWGEAETLEVDGRLRVNPTNAALAQGSWEIRGQQCRSPWLTSTSLQCSVNTLQGSTNLWPETVHLRLGLEQLLLPQTNVWDALARAGWSPSQPATVPEPARVKAARLEADLTLPPIEQMELGATNVSWLTRLDQVRGQGQVELQAVRFLQFDLEKLDLSTRWSAPNLAIDLAQARLYGGQMSATARLDVVTRELTFRAVSEVDPHRLAPIFTTNANPWSSTVKWERPPRLEASLSAQLPSWTNRAPDRWRKALPTLTAKAHLQGAAGAIGSIPIASSQASFTLSNHVWQVRDLEIRRPEGVVRLSLDMDHHTDLFYGRLFSTVDPTSLRPLFTGKDAQQAMDYFQFTQPPRLEAEVWGNGKECAQQNWEHLGLRGRIALTNFSFRGQAMQSVVGDVAYTNQALDFFNPRVQREEGLTTADQVRVDFARGSVSLTNAQGTVEVAALARAIGPHIVKTLQPYHYFEPPTIHFQGTIGVRSQSGLDDARFEVSGGAFQWQNFKFSRTAAHLHWLGDTLAITNFEGTLKDGDVQGDGWFDFSGDSGMTFRFGLTATNVNAKPLLTDLFPATTNQLEGLLSGRLVITNANAASDKSWFGYGDVSLRDGLIWNEPLFHLFSPILNAVVPGLGYSRARQASASFLITNSVIATRDLEIRASAMRMQLDGTVDFEGRLQGKMEASLLRDTPGFGWMISRVLWPVTRVFAYKVTGSLSHPKIDPLYVPKILMAPFHPLRTVKELFSDDKPEEKNDPPAKPGGNQPK